MTFSEIEVGKIFYIGMCRYRKISTTHALANSPIYGDFTMKMYNFKPDQKVRSR